MILLSIAMPLSSLLPRNRIARVLPVLFSIIVALKESDYVNGTEKGETTL